MQAANPHGQPLPGPHGSRPQPARHAPHPPAGRHTDGTPLATVLPGIGVLPCKAACKALRVLLYRVCFTCFTVGVSDLVMVNVRVGRSVRDAWRVAACAEGVSLSVWLRGACDVRAGSSVEERGGPIPGVAGSSPAQPLPVAGGERRPAGGGSGVLSAATPPVSSGSLSGGVGTRVVGLAASVPGVTVGHRYGLSVDGRPLFDDVCDLRAVHRGSQVCRVCGGVTW